MDVGGALFIQGASQRKDHTPQSNRNMHNKSDKSKSIRVAIIAHLPTHDITALPLKEFLLNFIDLLRPLCDDIYVIAGNFLFGDRNVHVLEVKTCSKKQLLIRALEYMLIHHIQVSVKLIQISSKINTIILYLSGPLILPILVAKLLKKRVSIYVTGLGSKDTKHLRSGWARCILPRISRLLEYACFTLVDQIIVESASVVQFLNLARYQNKVAVMGGTYIDTELFSVKNRVAERKNMVGYVGRVTGLKGVANFAQAISLVAKDYSSDVEFLVIGSGDLLEQIKQDIEKTGHNDRVTFIDWVSHSGLPDYLNCLKLLVLPSYTEGLPAVVQEAMACGAVVLATPVGGVPDLIKDEETGFIMENNSPECIAKNIIRALEHPKLGEIAQNAHQLIEKEYTYDILVKECRLALDRLTNLEDMER